jgi:transposase
MRGSSSVQSAMFSCLTLEERVPSGHPLRSISAMFDGALDRLEDDFAGMYSKVGRPSIAPEKLLRALLLQVLYSLPSERRLMERIRYDMLFRWFIGLEMDDPVWDVTVFSKNRDRLIEAEVSRLLLAAVVAEADKLKLLSEEHFTVDGTLIQAWAAARSFVPRTDPPPPAAGDGSGDGGRVLLRDKVVSTTDPDARLYRKASADRSIPCFQGHVLMENRNGLAMAGEASLSATDAEREVALALLKRVVPAPDKRNPKHRMTLGADTQYQASDFINGLREHNVAPHVSEYGKGNLAKNQLTEDERNDPRLDVSRKCRKRVESIFGWGKLDRMLGQVKVRGQKKVNWLFQFVLTGYNLIRMRRLIELQAAP